MQQALQSGHACNPGMLQIEQQRTLVGRLENCLTRPGVVVQLTGTGNSLTEVEVDDQLRASRAAQPGFIDYSFPTIAGAGPNGAIIHYRAQPGTCRSATPAHEPSYHRGFQPFMRPNLDVHSGSHILHALLVAEVVKNMLQHFQQSLSQPAWPHHLQPTMAAVTCVAASRPKVLHAAACDVHVIVPKAL